MSILHPDARARYQQFDRMTAEADSQLEHRGPGQAAGSLPSSDRLDPKDRAASVEPARR